ncbi:MAG: ATP-binding protein [Oscillospiraceae bacterium]|nr:ATP-binding protein [Oscillospiraceae bacterium]
MRFELKGRIDSNNASMVEKELMSRLMEEKGASVELDAAELEYISSAGLRVLLRIRKEYPDMRIFNVSPEVYEVFDMTGFTEMMSVEKAYRVVSVEGCEVIGEGFNGKVYRIDQDNVVKVYKNADALAEIQHEREVARLALILGVPTALSYDVVKVGESYGSVFELLNARSFAKILAEEPEKIDWCVKEYVEMLKKIHSIDVPAGKLPPIKAKAMERIRRMKSALPEGYGEKLERMAEAIPESGRMIHGDYHTKNIVLVGDEVLLIDMDTLSVGNPIFELAQMYNSYVGFSEYNPQVILDFQGYDTHIAHEFWHKSLAAYLNTEDRQRIAEAEDKIRCIAYASLIDWKNRHASEENEESRATLELWKKRLTELLDRVDSLDFDPAEYEGGGANELDIEALTENLPKVTEFVDVRLEKINCPPKAQMQIGMAVEEIFVNIANYAYAPDKGNATVRVEVSEDPVSVTITFIDHGVPYDPLSRDDPDISAPVDERDVGGLGIFMTKRLMDDVSYEYRNGQNILTLKKNL